MYTEQGAEAVQENISSAASPERRRLQPYTLEELLRLPDVEYLIKGVLDRNSLSVMRGPSNSGKTFAALDMALHIALGWNWRGQKTRQGKVLYIAAEAGFGIKKRIKAFMHYYDLKEIPNFYLLPKSVNFCSTPEDAEEIIHEVEILSGVELVVVDTLSRALAGGDENGPEAMGAFVMNCDLIRQDTLAAVQVVHHTGKDEARGGRGHSCLLGAIDTELAVTGAKGVVTAEITKQRDGEKGIIYSSALRVINLGSDADGDPITSCVLVPESAATPGRKQKRRKLGQKERALDHLQKLIVAKGQPHVPTTGMRPVKVVKVEDFEAELKNGNIAKSDNPVNIGRSINRVITELNKSGITATWEDYIWIPDKSDNAGQK